jgi:Zn ribbon nucleic-acid-binding protein
MRRAYTLEGAFCPQCNEQELVWWSENETETTTELYLVCDGCNREFPKMYAEAGATSYAEYQEQLRERYC